MRKLFALAMVGLLAICGATLVWEVTAFASTKYVAVVTESGPVRGISQSGENRFLGIPYAAPPVGALRWMPPQPRGKWQGLLDATRFGNLCPQTFADPNKVVGDEDCLFLNIYTPNGDSNDQDESGGGAGDGLPVMVWIHGGGYSNGSGSETDPAPLVDGGHVIVVTINYRLNVLGFFAQSALDAEGHPSANYGLMDQQFALKWVRRNIKAFGGDPNRVTIFGHSAGGQSVYFHLVSPPSGGLFQRAIAQSGALGASFAPYLAMQTLQDAEPAGNAFAAKVGCSDQSTQCLRKQSASVLVQVQPFSGPVVDGEIIPEAPGAAFPAGHIHHVPVISGSDHDERRLNLVNDELLGPGPTTDAAYPDEVAAFLGVPNPDPSGLLQYFLDHYPLTDYPPPPGVMSAPLALGAMGTDGLFACTARIADEGLSQYTPTYAYEFADENAPLPYALPFAYFQAPPGFIPSPLSFPAGAYHGSELFYLFNFGATLGTDQKHLADTMIRYWSHFARTGDPNVDGTPQWPLYSVATDQFQSLRPPTPIVKLDFATDHKCAVWGL
ncbi:MAG TPA: carboxylesterase family protein [Candidatus Binataceae bacterium]|nr:carboxylesterase family protein [Candidatus Binataceae bacterium]